MTKCTDCGVGMLAFTDRPTCIDCYLLRRSLLKHALQHGAVDTRRIVEEVLRAVEKGGRE